MAKQEIAVQKLRMRGASVRYGVSPRTLYRYLAKGAFSATKLGPVLLIDAAEADHWFSQLPKFRTGAR
jgi:hypothetical protein